MLGSRRRYPAQESSADERGQDEDKSDDEEQSDDETPMLEEIFTEAQLLPCDAEKKQVLSMFDSMRKDSFFCDVAFLCQGVLFRCHRVLVSSWSRWLRALLCESPDEEIVSFDFFDPEAFGAILDYMYGVPLTINVDNADNIIKVVRRLEMQKLEQQCWRFLMTIIDPDTNCEKLHELADRYDCPPLKLAAWRILQETRPGYGTSPNATKLLKGASKAQMEAMQNMLGFTGMTGPGEPGFSSMVTVSKAEEEFPGAGKGDGADAADGGGGGDDDDDDDDHGDNDDDEQQHEANRKKRRSTMPSVFGDEDVDEEDRVDDDDDDNSEVQSDAEQGILYRKRGARRKVGDKLTYTDPDQLDALATATDVIKAWASRLSRVYDTCAAEAEAAEYADDRTGFKLPSESANVRLRSGRKGRAGHSGNRDRGSSGGDSSDNGDKRKGSKGSPPPPSRGRRPDPKLVPTAAAGRRHPANKGASSALPPAVGGKKHSVEWKEELRRFYTAVNLPEKIPSIPKVLELWKGREEQMISSLLVKYKSEIPAAMAEHLEDLVSMLETHTESSFVNKKTKSPPSAMKKQKSGGSSSSSAGGGGGGGGGRSRKSPKTPI